MAGWFVRFISTLRSIGGSFGAMSAAAARIASNKSDVLADFG
jgi:hypothetical protein